MSFQCKLMSHIMDSLCLPAPVYPFPSLLQLPWFWTLVTFPLHYFNFLWICLSACSFSPLQFFSMYSLERKKKCWGMWDEINRFVNIHFQNKVNQAYYRYFRKYIQDKKNSLSIQRQPMVYFFLVFYYGKFLLYRYDQTICMYIFAFKCFT